MTDTAVALEGLINEIVEEVLGIDPREDLGMLALSILMVVQGG